MAVAIVGAQYPFNIYKLSSALTGTSDGGAVLTFFGTRYNYTIPIPAKDVKTITMVSGMIKQLVSIVESNPKSPVPIEISFVVRSTGLAVTWKIGTCSDKIYTMSLDEFRSAVEIMRTVQHFYLTFFLRQMNVDNPGYVWNLCFWFWNKYHWND